MSSDEEFMQRALALAIQAEGHTSPNPMVGCVLVKDGEIIGEGWHRVAGEAHAEVEAIRNVQGETRGATLYVTLEPCNHHGRTPPCTDAILEAGIKRVVIGVTDPNPVAAGGISKLESNNIAVTKGVLETECQKLNRYYLHYQQTGLPFVIAKFAASLDGKTATRSRHSQWITGSSARQRGHDLRQAVDAIIVGAQTAIDDDPQLTTRRPDTESGQISNPLRIVLDGSARVPLDKKLYTGTLPGKTLVVTTKLMSKETEATLNSRGIEILRLGTQAETERQDDKANNHISPTELLKALGERSIQSVLIEGGQAVLGSFHDARLINEIWAFFGLKLIGGVQAPSALGGSGIELLGQAAELSAVTTEQLGSDILIHGKLNYPNNHPLNHSGKTR